MLDSAWKIEKLGLNQIEKNQKSKKNLKALNLLMNIFLENFHKNRKNRNMNVIHQVNATTNFGVLELNGHFLLISVNNPWLRICH